MLSKRPQYEWPAYRTACQHNCLHPSLVSCGAYSSPPWRPLAAILTLWESGLSRRNTRTIVQLAYLTPREHFISPLKIFMRKSDFDQRVIKFNQNRSLELIGGNHGWERTNNVKRKLSTSFTGNLSCRGNRNQTLSGLRQCPVTTVTKLTRQHLGVITIPRSQK